MKTALSVRLQSDVERDDKVCGLGFPVDWKKCMQS